MSNVYSRAIVSDSFELVLILTLHSFRLRHFLLLICFGIHRRNDGLTQHFEYYEHTLCSDSISILLRNIVMLGSYLFIQVVVSAFFFSLVLVPAHHVNNHLLRCVSGNDLLLMCLTSFHRSHRITNTVDATSILKRIQRHGFYMYLCAH